MRVAAVIPAWNEASTVPAVVDAARRACLVDEVLVVDNNSADDTGLVARAAGARVVTEHEPGKGQAMAAGVAATTADIIVFLDADLLGVSASHVDSLVAPLLADDADMACGLFDRGPVSNEIYLHALPILTGQRAMHRDLFELLAADDIDGYKVEAALNSMVRRRGLRRRDVVLDGLWHRTKEEKYPSPAAGFAHKVAMLTTAVWSYLRFAVRYRLVAPLAERSV